MATHPDTPVTSSYSLLPAVGARLKSSLSRRSLPLLVTFLLLLPGILAACGGGSSGPSNGGTLLFGAPISLTGATSNEGHLTLEGYQLWVKETNAHGGIKVGDKTYQVALKYYD